MITPDYKPDTQWLYQTTALIQLQKNFRSVLEKKTTAIQTQWVR